MEGLLVAKRRVSFYGLLGKNDREGKRDLFDGDVCWLWEDGDRVG